MKFYVTLWAVFLICINAQAQTNNSEDDALEHIYDGVDYRWYWNTNIGIVVPDDDIRLNEAQVIDLRVGKHLNEHWAVEFEVMRDEYDFDIDFDLKHYSAAFNVMYTDHDPLWKPYFLVGVGGIYSDSRFPDTQESDLIVNLAVGGSWYFTGNGARIRAEARARLDSNNSNLPGQDGFGDGQFTIGIIVPIGD